MATSSSLSSIFALALLSIFVFGRAGLAANPSKEMVCDVTADHHLTLEDYIATIGLHRAFLQKHPANALAHYHLGFAYGMTGDGMQELHEYQYAIKLGLSRWDLFLNTGVAYLTSGNLPAATDALQHAVQLDPSQPDSHYNLGLVYERRGMLPEAEQEMLSTLRLEPEELDARNMLGIIYARQGKKAEASAQWGALLRKPPEYNQARKNIAILEGKAVEGHGKDYAHAAATPSLPQTAHETAPTAVKDVFGKP